MQLPGGNRPAFQHVGGRAVAPGATITALTMNAGDSNLINSFDQPQRGFIVNAWNKSQAVGKAQIRSQRMHDNNNGFRWSTITGAPFPQWPMGNFQEVFSQDSITYEISGSAVAGDFELLSSLIYYSKVAGIAQRLITWQEYYQRKMYDLTIETSITGGVGGGYTGEVNINTSTVFNLKANTDYALTGFLVNTDVQSVVWKGPDTGQTRVGGPGNSTNKEVTREWFVILAKTFDVPFIPVINSANAGATTIGVMCDENGGTFIVNTLLAQLR
jgi:hypothetical protein